MKSNLLNRPAVELPCIRLGFSLLVCAFLSSAPAGQAGQAAGGDGEPYDQKSERGPHHRLRTFVQPTTNEVGIVALKTNRYTELQAGMHYWEDGRWKESQEQIEVFRDGALARKGQHKVIFAPNARTAGAIDMLASDGKRFRSHVLGLAYYDSATGNSVMFAEIKDSIGQLVAPNQIVYPDAFTDIKADIRYEWTKGGFEQDIILLEFPAPPETYGLASLTTRMQVWTEYLDPPQPTKTGFYLRQEHNQLKRLQMVEPDLVDEMLDFGAMATGFGQAFMLSGEARTHLEPAKRVAKKWQKAEGRDFLIEQVEYQSMVDRLRDLKQGAKLEHARPSRKTALASALFQANLPKLSGGPPFKRTIQVASAPYRPKGFVVDYYYVATASNFTFQKGRTYYVSGNATLSGTTTFEGPTVIKYAPWTYVSVTGAIVCNTGMYRPLYCTARDDNSVGEQLSESTGTPSGTYANPCLIINTGSAYVLSDFRAKHANIGVSCQSSADAIFRHFQISARTYGLQVSANSGIVRLENGLICDANSAFDWYNSSWVYAENSTVAGTNLNATAALVLTNCVLSVTNAGTYYGLNNQVLSPGTFSQAGGGKYYLAGASSARNAGITNITPTLLSDLRARTTTAPDLISGYLFHGGAVQPVVPLDNDALDLGYHYDPVDFVFTNATLVNEVLSVAPGTTIASYGNGLSLKDGASVAAIGGPSNPVKFVNQKFVQEVALNSTSADVSFDTTGAANSAVNLKFQFCQFETPFVIKEPRGIVSFHSSVFPNTTLQINRTSGTLELSLINCLFENSNINGSLNGVATTVSIYNCTLIGEPSWAGMSLGLYTNTTFTVKDTLFDKAVASLTPTGIAVHDYNGYRSGYDRLQPAAAHDVVLASIGYDAGPLGGYYLASGSSFINAGSRAANNATLYHFTTGTSQTKETTSTVDIGFHYVALNGQNQPIDTDSDSFPDWLEDADGDGVFDSGEMNWNGTNYPALKVRITKPGTSTIVP